MNGILPLYKPTGMTSADAVYHARKILGIKKLAIPVPLILMWTACCRWRLVQALKRCRN
ncbi:tRNA pseudouridine synthase B [Lacticaseibacillus paracasei]|nr:tRNA pseudouridine synthase B [Lacticaseibacillus paracasei]